MNLSLEIRRIEIPLRKANGNHMREHTRCQKLFFVLKRVIYASVRSQKVRSSLATSVWSGISTGDCSVGDGVDLVEEMLIDLYRV